MIEDKSRKELCKSILDKIGISLKKIGSYELFINKKTISEMYVLTISKTFHPYELKISNDDDDIEQLF